MSSDLLELELQMIVSQHVGAETQILFQDKCSELLSQLCITAQDRFRDLGLLCFADLLRLLSPSFTQDRRCQSAQSLTVTLQGRRNVRQSRGRPEEST